MLAFYNYVINADGSGLRPLLPEEPNARINLMSWSPDGRRMVFGQLIDNRANVFTANKDGSGKIQITHFTGGALGSIVWSPTGARIAFGRDNALYIVNADGSDLRKIIDVIGLSEIHWVPQNK